MVRSPLQLPGLFFKDRERIINRTNNNTSDSLKASMVAPLADKPREESTLAWSHYRSRSQRVTETQGGFIDLFFLILFSILIYYI